LTDDRAFGADDVASRLYTAERLRKLRFLMTDNREPGSRRFEISVEELGALLSGINLSNATRRKRYRRTNA